MVLFAAVVREGSFTRGARQLGITKQTASERIRNLEESLGVRLLERTTRSLRLTDSGATYHERCAAIAAQIQEANDEVQRRQAEPIGLLRISAPVLYGRLFLAPVVAEFLGRHPKARVDMVLTDHRLHLIQEGIDLAIRIGKMEDSSLTAKKLGEGYIYYVASPQLLSRYRTQRQTLGALPSIGFEARETWRAAGAQWKVAPVLIVNDIETAYEAALAGVGVARLPAVLCRRAVEKGELRVIFGPDPAASRGVYVVYPSRRHLPSKCRLFLQALTALVEPMRALKPSHGFAPKHGRSKREM